MIDFGPRMPDTESMNKEEFLLRTKKFGLRIIRLVTSLPRSAIVSAIGNQLLRSGTSVGANYRAAVRGKSRADFISKMGTVEEECDESLYWMEMLIESGFLKPSVAGALMKEGEEILSMVVASIKTARRNK
jgi:four helix bundle protein